MTKGTPSSDHTRSQDLVGRPFDEARAVAAKQGFAILDVSEPGWYADVLDRKRFRVVTDDEGKVVSAQVG